MKLLEIVFYIDLSTSGHTIGSLADAPNDPHRVATISFSIRVPSQLSIVNKKVERRHSMKDFKPILLCATFGSGSAVPTRVEIVFDYHFLGVIPLTFFLPGQGHKIESVYNPNIHQEKAIV